ncbi:MAG: ArsR family transcriptional regulator [Anaerolineae bacterium]
MDTLATATPTWKVFSNPVRNRIIELLKTKPHTTGELCTHFEISRFAVMQHLKVLEKSRIVTAEKRGRYRWNHLDQVRLDELKTKISLNPSQKPLLGTLQKTRSHRPEIEFQCDYAAPLDRVFHALTCSIDQWWTETPATSYPIVKLEPRIGGRFYNCFDAADNGILYAIVDQFKDNELLGMTGNMGSDFTISIIRFRLVPLESNGTRLTLLHRFIGEPDETTYEAFQQSWQQLLAIRLKFLIEKN